MRRRLFETSAFLLVTFAVAWPMLARSLGAGDFEGLVGLAMCVPGGVGLLLALVLRREGPAAARVGVGVPWAWVVAFLAPLALIGAVALLASGVGAFELHPDFKIALPYVGSARGLRASSKLALFLLVLHATFVLPAVLEDRTRMLPRPWRAVVRLLAWSVPMAVAHISGEFGEELGWRGFLVRRWEDRPVVAVLVSSVAWSLFHLPWAIAIGHLDGVPRALTFLVSLTLLGVPMAALYRWGRSVWPCAIAHGGLDAWGAVLLGSPLFPQVPSYGHVPGGWASAPGIAVFTLVAVLSWRAACGAPRAPA